MLVNPIIARWKADLAPSTAYHRAAIIRRALKALEIYGAPPQQITKLKRPQARPVIASGLQIEALLRHAPAWQRLFILLAWQMALRFGECLRVTPRSYNRETLTVSIRVKGGKVRTIPTTPDVDVMLAAAGETEGREDVPYIFLLKGGPPVTVHGMRCSWWRLCKAANVEGIHPHDLRRTTGTALYAVSKDLRAVQQFLGHESLASTTAYLAPLTEDQLRDYHRLLNFHSQVKQ